MNIEDYTALCAAYGSELNPEISAAGEFAGDGFGLHTNMLSAIRAAGRLLRKHPGNPLSSVPPELPSARYGFPAMVLTRMIAASHRPLHPSEVTDSERYFRSAEAQDLGTCDVAETDFAQTVAELVPGYQGSHGGYQIMSSDRQPIFIRKKRGNPSAMSLVSVCVNGIPYPAGSLFRLDTAYDYFPGVDDTAAWWEHSLPLGTQDAIQTRAVTNVAFLRLSAFAFRRWDERREFGGIMHLESRQRRAARLPMRHIAQLAAQAPTDNVGSLEEHWARACSRIHQQSR